MNIKLKKLLMTMFLGFMMVFLISCGKTKDADAGKDASGKDAEVSKIDVNAEMGELYFEPTEITLKNGMVLKGTHIPFDEPLLGDDKVKFGQSLWSDNVLYMIRGDKIVAFAYKEGGFFLNSNIFDGGILDNSQADVRYLAKEPKSGDIYGKSKNKLYKVEKDGLKAQEVDPSGLPDGAFVFLDSDKEALILSHYKTPYVVKDEEGRWDVKKTNQTRELLGFERVVEFGGYSNGEILLMGGPAAKETYLFRYDTDFNMIKKYENSENAQNIISTIKDFFVDKDGNLVILDGNMRRIEVFGDDGRADGPSLRTLSNAFLEHYFVASPFVHMDDGAKIIMVNKDVGSDNGHETIAIKVEFK